MTPPIQIMMSTNQICLTNYISLINASVIYYAFESLCLQCIIKACRVSRFLSTSLWHGKTLAGLCPQNVNGRSGRMADSLPQIFSAKPPCCLLQRIIQLYRCFSSKMSPRIILLMWCCRRMSSDCWNNAQPDWKFWAAWYFAKFAEVMRIEENRMFLRK